MYLTPASYEEVCCSVLTTGVNMRLGKVAVRIKMMCVPQVRELFQNKCALL